MFKPFKNEILNEVFRSVCIIFVAVAIFAGLVFVVQNLYIPAPKKESQCIQNSQRMPGEPEC